MKPLRVVMDVSFCGMLHGIAQSATGVGRVIESTVARLKIEPGLDLALTGCRGGDPRPAFTSAEARRYWQARWAGEGVPYAEPIGSRAFASYREALYTLNREPRPCATRRLARAGLNRLAHWSARPRLPGVGVFHSPFFALPPREIVGDAVRLLTVHDLIPLASREDTEARRTTLAMLASFDPGRDWAIAVSAHTRRAFCAATGVEPERVAVIPLAAEPHFHPRQERAALDLLVAEGPFFLSVANPQPRKNLPFLIRAAAAAGAGRLVLAGAGAPWGGLAPLQAEAARHPELEVIWLEGVGDEALAALYSHCTAFLFPSLDEGFGLPPLEAMQCGAPVVCSNAASLPEVAGEAALLLDPRDERAWVAALRAVASDPALRARLSAAGLQRATHFSWEKTAAQTAACYKEIAPA